MSCRVWQEDEGYYRHADRQAALKSEKIAPVVERAALDLKSAEGQQSSEGVGYVTRRIEDRFRMLANGVSRVTKDKLYQVDDQARRGDRTAFDSRSARS